MALAQSFSPKNEIENEVSNNIEFKKEVNPLTSKVNCKICFLELIYIDLQIITSQVNSTLKEK